MIILRADPVPKPRMTRADKWKKRACVMRYRAFCDIWRASVPADYDLNGAHFIFTIGMPPSWSKKKKAAMDGKPHTQRPDLDNILKGVFDAHLSEDCGINSIRSIKKVWGRKGSIMIY